MFKISLMDMDKGPNLIGRTNGALLLASFVEDIISSHLSNGLALMTKMISLALYPLSMSLDLSCV